MSTKNFKDLRITKEVLDIFSGHESAPLDMLLRSKTRKTAIVPTTGGESDSPAQVGEYRLVGTVLGCSKGEGFSIVSSPYCLRG
jgi:hypothetical protein